ncbi:MAG: putative inorganic carbon transporter subunit DabA, partial [Bryobacteraceae bacterium]
QMVEVHEPVRVLFVVESTPERVMKVMSANAELSEFLGNRWVRLATIDPDTGAVWIRRGGEFEKLNATLESLPSAPSSADWFRGRIEHLPIARISREAT